MRSMIMLRATSADIAGDSTSLSLIRRYRRYPRSARRRHDGPRDSWKPSAVGMPGSLTNSSATDEPGSPEAVLGERCGWGLCASTGGVRMTEVSLDGLGPVDYVVVEFPAGASNFTGEMASELRALVDKGIIRVIDVLILTKDSEGAVEAMELSDVDELGELQQIETELAELLAADDVENLAAAMEPGSTAGVLIWENLWAAPFASAARRSGGQLIADGRIPIQAIIASIDADQETATVGE